MWRVIPLLTSHTEAVKRPYSYQWDRVRSIRYQSNVTQKYPTHTRECHTQVSRTSVDVTQKKTPPQIGQGESEKHERRKTDGNEIDHSEYQNVSFIMA